MQYSIFPKETFSWFQFLQVSYNCVWKSCLVGFWNSAEIQSREHLNQKLEQRERDVAFSVDSDFMPCKNM
jgi:hypothetical protein